MHLSPSLNQSTSFDIAFVDTDTHTLATTDRNNKSIDVWDTEFDRFIRASDPVFAGITANRALGGPNGVYIIGRGGRDSGEAWAGDGDSTVKVIDLNTGHEIGSPIPTGGATRADELWYDAAAQEIMIGVPDQPSNPPSGEPTYPFEAFISTAGTPGPSSLKAQLVYDGTGAPCAPATVGSVTITRCHTPSGDVATNGLEQPIVTRGFNNQGNGHGNNHGHLRGDFWLAVPGSSSPAVTGRVDEIDPDTYQVVNEISMPQCGPTGPTGLTIVSESEAAAACPTGVGFVNLAGLTEDGAPIAESGGADQIWYNPGNGNVDAPNRTPEPNGCAATGVTVDTPTPQTGLTAVCVAVVHGNNGSSASVVAEVQLPVGAGSHSVSADSNNNQAFVPTADLDCTTGTCPPTSSVTPCPVSLEQGGCIHDQGVAVIELGR
jgi:hypothetical protein